MKFFFAVGSTNQVKINAVKQAIGKTWPTAEVSGFKVKSGVAAQPMSDEETRVGARARAERALTHLQEISKNKNPTDILIGIGLEGGVYQPRPIDAPAELWSVVWVSLIDDVGRSAECSGARFLLPAALSARIVTGQEMGDAASELSGTPEINRKEGMLGLVTNSFTNRTEEYQSLARLAIGLWYGQVSAVTKNWK